MTGKVSYAVLSFGGFPGIGDDHYPLPWQSLKYDTNLGGYRTGITETQLKGAPKYSNDKAWNWADAARARSVDDYYRRRNLKAEEPTAQRAVAGFSRNWISAMSSRRRRGHNS
jgi:hypothetical protein